ncbi:hypothetical protein [Siminovitchia fordii]|uniref:Uncharacterized protein n=1 Tax=Siminovitchia fordii TaxID=254759 RepID=A0ABQ4KEP1_9BACI|nr:hypothetical protein [Siminovitchia fordii]GIN23338.1 hypothetical protein J1TS3_44720 [Siminovitchia fordii]
MALIQLKISKNEKMPKYISLIRKFDSTIPMSEIKRNIENNMYVVSFDLHSYDVLDDIRGIDRKMIFRQLISDLMQEGADVHIYDNGNLWTLEHLDNWLATIREIEKEVEWEIDMAAKEE